MSILRSVAAVLVLAGGLGGCENGTDPEDRIPARVEVVDGSGQQGAAGQALAQPVRVRVVDDRGRPVPGQAVNFIVTAGGGSVSVAAVTTNNEGIAATQWTLGTSAGAAQTLEARVAGPNGQAIVSDPLTATARAAAAAKLVSATPTQPPQAGSVGGPTRDSLAVQVLDQYNNPVPGATVSWAVAAENGGGSVSPAQSTTNANGIARAQWTLGTFTNGLQVATASVAGAPTLSLTARAANNITPVQGNNITASGGTTITPVATLG
ncbi:MAG TPA: Ig-like domain-containing protein, partial [Longimicrobium sp.]|nr:Ig-like domain-containing protein [Longimicrobium sp.]